MVKIKEIKEGSVADYHGLKKGDIILSINGKTIGDYIDFQYETADNLFMMEIERNRRLIKIEIERQPGDELGIIPEGIIYDKLKLCNNNCIFCFVQQQPEGMRKTLNLKDDDYRFSFLQGSFITLSNLSKVEFERIIKMRLSPLNISVHTTNPKLRKKMMRNPRAAYIMSDLKYLSKGGIDFNTQIVLCPGFNDGIELDKTISDLFKFYPNLLSIGIVPVGLTKYRKDLYPLEGYNNKKARELLKQIEFWQHKSKRNFGKNIVYASDEFYFLAGDDIPEYDEYNDFPQIENGIGLTRLLWDKFSRIENSLPEKVDNIEAGIITGQLGEKAMQPIIDRLNKIKGLNIKLYPVKNQFFGQSVTVTGLLTASDIIKGIKNISSLPTTLILPGIVINENGMFLDDLTIKDIRDKYTDLNIFCADSLEEMLEVIFIGKTDSSNSGQTKCRKINFI